jgi:hypothetical protein
VPDDTLPTVTVAETEDVPPAPEQASTNVVVAASAPVTWEPEVGFVPLHPPEAVHEVALLEDQLRVAVPPAATSDGVAVNATVGTGGAALTTTLAVCAIDPPAPVHVSVYE